MIQKIILIYILSCLVLSCNERSKKETLESIDLCTEYTINDIWNDRILLQNYFLKYFEEPNEQDIIKNKLQKFVRIINYRKDDTCSIFTFKIGETCTNLSIKKTEPVFFSLMKSNSTELNKNIVYMYERKIFYFVNFKELKSQLSNLYMIQAPYEEENKTQVEYFDGEKYNTQLYKSYDIAFLEQIIIQLK